MSSAFESPGLSDAQFAALRGELMKASASLSTCQMLDLADTLHGMIRLRRPGRPVRDACGWLSEEPRSFEQEITGS